MTGRASKTTPPAKPAPFIRSKIALRALVTGITLTTFTGMSAFAATHIQNAAAPLKPSANGASTTTSTSFATPAPTAPSRTTTTGRVPTTTQIAPRTKTRSS